MTQEAIDKIVVLSEEQVATRAKILDDLEKARIAVISFFGGESAEGESLVIEATPAHSLVMRASGELTLASDIKINTAAEYQVAADSLQRLKGIAKDLEASRKGMTTSVDAAKAMLQAFFAPATSFLTRAEAAYKTAMGAFDAEQQRLQRLEDAKAQEEAKKQAEKLQERANKAEAKGQTAVADELSFQAASIVAQPSAAAPVAAAGISKTATYTAEIKKPIEVAIAVASVELLKMCGGDAAKLLEIVKTNAASNTPANFVEPNTKIINAMVKMLKDAFNYPGIEVLGGVRYGARAK